MAGTVLAGANATSFDATRSATITALAGAGTAGNLTIDVGAPIKAGGNVSLNAAATIANSDTVTALNGNAALTAAANINNNGLVVAVKNDATLGAGGTINNPGGVSAGHDARLTAGNDINTSGNVSAGHNSVLTAGANIAETGGVITAAGPGAAGAPSVALTAQTGSISQGAGAVISATDASGGDLGLTAAAGIVANGTMTAAGAVAGTLSVALTAQAGSISQGVGGIISATNTTSGDLALTAATDIVANGVVTAAGAVAGTPSVALTAQAGSISQAAGGTISATNTTSGDLALTAATDILANGAVTGAGASGRHAERCADRTGRIDQPGCGRDHLRYQQHFRQPRPERWHRHRRERRHNRRWCGGRHAERCADRTGRIDQPGCGRDHLRYQHHFRRPRPDRWHKHRRKRRRNRCRRSGGHAKRCVDRTGRIDQPGCGRDHLGDQHHVRRPRPDRSHKHRRKRRRNRCRRSGGHAKRCVDRTDRIDQPGCGRDHLGDQHHVRRPRADRWHKHRRKRRHNRRWRGGRHAERCADRTGRIDQPECWRPHRGDKRGRR